MNKTLIEQKTAALVNQLGIADQLAGFTTAAKLTEVGARLGKLRSLGSAGQAAKSDCALLARLAVKYGCK